MLNALVIEGPDGAGKTTLKETILEAWPDIQEHPRAATSLGGPQVDLKDYTANAQATIDGSSTPVLFDRHPIISGCVYGPILQDDKNAILYQDHFWLRLARQKLSETALTVWCLPPWETVSDNIENSLVGHMPGVEENLKSIYLGYQVAFSSWPTNYLLYDYTEGMKPFASLAWLINNHIMRRDND